MCLINIFEKPVFDWCGIPFYNPIIHFVHPYVLSLITYGLTLMPNPITMKHLNTFFVSDISIIPCNQISFSWSENIKIIKKSKIIWTKNKQELQIYKER